MPVNWMDITDLSFNVLLLLEREQLAWLPGWLPEPAFATALKANPVVEWYLRHKNPKLDPWIDKVLPQANPKAAHREIRDAEEIILRAITLVMRAGARRLTARVVSQCATSRSNRFSGKLNPASFTRKSTTGKNEVKCSAMAVHSLAMDRSAM